MTFHINILQNTQSFAMDLLPLIPESLTNHEVAPSIRTNLQTELDENIYCKDVAENYLQSVHVRDADYLVENAKSVIDIYTKTDEDIRKTQVASVDIMIQQAKYLIRKEKINSCSILQEFIKLKRCDLFKKLEAEFVVDYNLIQSSDLLPDLVKRYLDYRDGNGALCAVCTSKIKINDFIYQKRRKVKARPEKQMVDKYKNSYEVIPNDVVFHNYEIGQIYQKMIKIINTSPTLQAIGLESFPKSSSFSIMFNNNTQRLAAGMCATATVTFKPKVFRTLRDNIRFKNQLGELVDTHIFATRDAPKLISCVFKSNTNLVEHSEPYCRFEEKRREALNSTIDCGSCLVSQYVLISIILENRGTTSKFFFMTEDDWFFKNIDDISSCMELVNASFWMYPIYFKIKKGEVVEISTIFQPTKAGLHVETLYLMCDNNTFQQIELVGDAIEFSKRLIEIEIPPANTEIINEEGFTIYLGHVYNKSIKNFTIIVRNRSALSLNCEWKFRNNKSDNIGDIEENWITQKCYYANIAPYATTEFDFDICLDSKTFGYHSIFFCFYILNIPLISLKENEDFIVIERENISGKALSEAVDVLCTEIEVCMSIEKEEDSLQCSCKQTSSPPEYKSNMFFSCPFVNFGILPFGLQVRKELYIRNDSFKKLSWTILEVEYNIDVPPYMEIIRKPHVRGCTHGVCNPGGFKKLFYEIPIRGPLSYVSMLILISMDTKFNTNIEDICIISYEIINFDIQIRTKQTTFPILCPLEIVYKGIPTEIQFSIENHSPIIGYFEFLSPVGEDIDKIFVELNPSSSVIKPLETITITAKLLCTETGLLEDFYIPCFVGMGQKPLTIKVLCVVEGPLLIFHLPVNNHYYKQVNWPNMVKDVFEFDVCECKPCNEEAGGYLPEYKYEPDVNYQPSLNEIRASNMPIFPDTLEHHLLKNQCGEGMTDPSIKEASASSNTHFIETKLENILRKEFNDIFLHDDIIEVHAVPIFTPTQVSIFIENTTPMTIKCNVEANNFTVKKNFDHVAVRLRLKTNENIWNDLMNTEYGIVVQPEIDQKVIKAHSNEKFDFWIYANTFGVYTEEIVIEVAEIPSYYFSLLIEVVGCPIQLPFALNSITTFPTIRFGTIPVNSPEIKRLIKITNVSSIPVNVMWQQLDENFGEATEKFFYVESGETYLKQHSSTYVDIIIKPRCSQIMNVTKNILIGYIHINLEYMKKSKYYLRKIYPNTNIIQLNVVAEFEIPSLKFDLLGNKRITFDIHANDVLLGKQYENKEYVVLRNTSAVAYETVLTVEYPFHFEACEDGPVQIRRVFLNPHGTSELTIHCVLDPDDLLCLSYLLYEEESDGTYIQEYNPKLVKFLGEYTIDITNKIICIAKEITAVQLDNVIQLPINLDLYYPLISVKPSTVKFGNVLVNQTYKDMITVFNHTGSIVKFEISKSSETDCFFITPHYGELPANTGTQEQSVNIFIYFCANECKKYSGSFKVVTNIPNYFTEVYLKGTGTINEKFTTTYKI